MFYPFGGKCIKIKMRSCRGYYWWFRSRNIIKCTFQCISYSD